MKINKVITKDDELLLDLTEDSVTPEDLLKGVTAHDKYGNSIVGTHVPKPGIVDVTIEEVA
jgi:hypothetical protein